MSSDLTPLIAALGGALVLATMVDVFATVLRYSYYGPLTRGLYRGTWRILRVIAVRLPEHRRDWTLRLALPLMIGGTIAMWTTLFLVGFALIYYDGMARDGFAMPINKDPTMFRALYMSGMTLSTVGYGDISPLRIAYEFLTVFEALLGFALVTLGLSYLLNVYGVLGTLSRTAAKLEHQARVGDMPVSILHSHIVEPGRLTELETRLQQLHEALLDYREGIQRYPVVYYFRSQHTLKAMPDTFRVIGQFVAALRWALPSDHPLTRNPWVEAMVSGYRDVADYIGAHFVAPEHRSDEEPVDEHTFLEQARGVAIDLSVRRFIRLEHELSEALGLDGDSAETDSQHYERYRRWTQFSTEAADFVRAAATDLAYPEPEHSYFTPEGEAGLSPAAQSDDDHTPPAARSDAGQIGSEEGSARR
jgi:hypothetical protein